MLTMEEIRQLLLHSVSGVLFLGVIGSLLGSIIIWAIKRFFYWYINEIALEHAFTVFFPYIKTIIISKELKKYLLDLNKKDDYKLICEESMISYFISSLFFYLSLTATVFLFIILPVHTPYPLIFMSGVTLYSAHVTIKSGLFYNQIRSFDSTEFIYSMNKKYKSAKSYLKY
ncbi:hypothetical protein L4D04_23870 [Photobacterium angustum]|jgi:hypothetical protein|uniref:hypothetical protein n=1 Tax=Photobacterium angustum TaxID=661 RepID=UPI003D09D9CA